ncbi:DUF2290 domain-containing protein [Sulfurimonas sp. NWX79]|uniref:DUF2290 domain-containing protein n=1 Tax=Sulfurimonas sp. NWX79 TaxID=2925412 RepID=UPI003204AD43
MNREFNKNITQCIQFLDQYNLLFQAGCITSLSASSEFKKNARKSTSYKRLYDIGTKYQDFNFMLIDKSFFQFSRTKIINKKTGEENFDLRFTYYPNPYKFVEYQENKIEIEHMYENNEITLEEYQQFLSEEFFTSDIPLIRYDLSKNQYCENYHPTAHFHIGFHAENRWPVKRELTPMSFMLKILMHYYIKWWKDLGDCGKNENLLTKIYTEELKKCLLLDNEHFSNIEEKRLYFS